jgi:hypothetical protein
MLSFKVECYKSGLNVNSKNNFTKRLFGKNLYHMFTN